MAQSIDPLHTNLNMNNSSEMTMTATTSTATTTTLMGPGPMLTPNPLTNSVSNLNVMSVNSTHEEQPQTMGQMNLPGNQNKMNTMTYNDHGNSSNNMSSNFDSQANNATSSTALPNSVYSNSWKVQNPLAGDYQTNKVSTDANMGMDGSGNNNSRSMNGTRTPSSILPVGGIRVPNPFLPNGNLQNGNSSYMSSKNYSSENANTNNDNRDNGSTTNMNNLSYNGEESNNPTYSSLLAHPNAHSSTTTTTAASSHFLNNTNPGKNNQNGNVNNSNTANNANNRRQKRLERNRESARLSRRRRKQYLEILEDRVSALSVQMDEGRTRHAAKAVSSILNLRNEKIQLLQKELDEQMNAMSLSKGEENGDSNESKDMDTNELVENEKKEKDTTGDGSDNSKTANISNTSDKKNSTTPNANENIDSNLNSHITKTDQILTSLLSRTSDSLCVVAAFQREQLKSYLIPPHVRFIQWLTLQNDSYFLGGRAASERLSAARIGERMLNAGNDRVPPVHGMWPLFCNEINLSYDQEERVRSFQRNIISTPNSWLDYRHNAQASAKINDSLYDCLLSFSSMSKQREQSSILKILTPEQRAKLYVWISKQSNEKKDILFKRSKSALKSTALKETQLELSKDYHNATNMYIVNNHLQAVLNSPITPIPQPVVQRKIQLKRLSRRPPFESLGGSGTNSTGSLSSIENSSNGSINKEGLSRERSFSSSGSLKRSASSLSNHERDRSASITSANGGDNSPGQSSLITPEAAQSQSHAAVAEALKPAGIDLPERIYVPPSESNSSSGEGGQLGDSTGDVVMSAPNATLNSRLPNQQIYPGQMHQQYNQQNQFSNHSMEVPGQYTSNKVHKIAPENMNVTMMEQPTESAWNWDNSHLPTPEEPVLSNNSITSMMNNTTLTAADKEEQNIMRNYYENTQQEQAQSQQQQHFASMRSVSVPSILPSGNTEMNIVPEEGEFNANQAVDDYLLDLGTENDWAIGGFDVEPDAQ